MKVGLFIPCLVDQFYPQTGISLVKILKKLKIDFEYPMEQTCCGQPMYNTGYRNEAKILARRFIDLFAKYDYVVAPSGSCTSMVKVLYPTLDFNDIYSDLSRTLSGRMLEFSEFLVDKLGVVDLGSTFKGKATYHNSCHLLRELGISTQPRTLIQNIKGIEFIESENSTICCGFGGTFSVKFPEISSSMVQEKVEGLLKTGAEYVILSDNSCQMQIDGYLQKNKLPMKAVHLADVLACGL
jgi:L-lactate dehydrogenase complex protein LldE